MTQSHGPARGAGEIRTEVTVTGGVSGQLAVGDNIVQVHVDRVLGNVVTVLPPGSAPRVTARPHPVRLVPGRAMPVFDRAAETARVLAELMAHRPVVLQAPPGMGKSTMVHHVAHHPDVDAAYGAVVCLSARGHTRDDLFQALFEAFYTSDVPVRPTRVQLRHLLQAVRAVVLLDDVDLPDDAVAELAELAPSCGFVLAGVRKGPWGAAASVPLSGLPADAAGMLLAHALGHPLQPTDQGAVYALWGLTRGAPARLIQLAVNATAYPGSLEAFANAAMREGPPPFAVDDPADQRLLALLAAMPGGGLEAEHLAAVSGVPDVAWRLQRWVERGVVTVSDLPDGTRTFGFACGGELDPAQWQLEERRAELVAYFATWARRHPDVVLTAGSAEPVRALQETARRHGAWRAVIALGLLLDVAYALAGRWDAWHVALQATLEAARAVGDRAVEALALHQLGTAALCRGDLAAALELLRAALDLRTALGQHAAAEVTRHNLATITVPPVPVSTGHDHGGLAGALAKVPTAAKVAAVLVPLLGALTFVGLGNAGNAPPPRFEPQRLAFTGQAVDQASAPQVIRLDNGGPAGLHVDNVAVSGPNHGAFTLVDTSCVGEVAAGAGCTATVVFTPATPGEQQASLSWRIREIPDDLASPLVGTGVVAPPTAPSANPDALVFGSQPLNTLSAPLSVRVTAGSGPLRLAASSTQGVESADFLVDGDGCAGAQLAARTACTVGVRFTPSAAGERSALLTVTDADGHPAATVALRGTGAVPPEQAVAVTPSALRFGDQAVGTASAGQPVTLTNGGGAPIDLGATTIAGSNNFAVTGSDCRGRLAPGAACRTTVTFTPTGAGPRDAQLLLGAPGRPSVPLRGSGVARPPTLPELSPSAVAFGEQATKTVSGPKTVTVTNRADQPLHLGGITVDDAGGAFRIEAGNCTDTTLPPGGSCRVVVRFAPARAGPYSGVLSVGVQGVDGHSATTLTGNATDPDTVVVPNVVGLPLSAAQRAVAAAGLRPGAITRKPVPDVAAGTVVDQTPTAGRTATRNQPVDLVVASDQVPVPELIGRTEAEAAARLDGIGLHVGRVDRRSDPSIAAGAVVACLPPSGTRVDRGSAVDLVVSTGPQLEVPDVVGKPLTEAQALIEGKKLAIGKITEVASDTVAKDVVISSNPEAGTPVKVSSRVGLTVSTGPPEVPDVVGKPVGVARSLIKNAGLVPGEVTRAPSGDYAKDAVISSSPQAGTPVKVGSRVDLTVSSGPPPKVPNVVGAPVDDALRTLGAAGLTAVDANRRPVPKGTKGTVEGTAPGAGEQAPEDKKVTLTVKPPDTPLG